MKQLRKLFSTFVMILCMFLLNACSGNQLDTNANIDVGGNYIASTYGDLKENAINKIDFQNENNTCKLTAKLSLSGAMTANLNGIIKGTNLDNLQAAFKLISIGARCEYYIKDKVLYFLDSENKQKANIPNLDLLKEKFNIPQIITLNNVFEKIEEANINNNLRIEKHTAKNETKFKVTFALKSNNSIFNYTIYFVFNSETLSGVLVNHSSSGYNISVVMQQYDKDIIFPDFDDFIESNIFNV